MYWLNGTGNFNGNLSMWFFQKRVVYPVKNILPSSIVSEKIWQFIVMKMWYLRKITFCSYHTNTFSISTSFFQILMWKCIATHLTLILTFLTVSKFPQREQSIWLIQLEIRLNVDHLCITSLTCIINDLTCTLILVMDKK